MSKHKDYHERTMAASITCGNSRFLDASMPYECALTHPTMTENQRIEAQYWYPCSLYPASFYRQSIAQFGDLYAAHQENKRYTGMVTSSYQRIIHVSLYLHSIGHSDYQLSQLQKLVNKGLDWLLEINRRDLDHTLLLNKSEIYYRRENETALDFAEEAYSHKKRFGGGFHQDTYIYTLARIARTMKEFHRTKEVVRSLNSVQNNPYSIMGVDTEYLLLMLEHQLLERIGALELVKHTLQRKEYIQSPFAVLCALGTCGELIAVHGLESGIIRVFDGIRELLNENYPELNAYMRKKALQYINKATFYVGLYHPLTEEYLDDLEKIFELIRQQTTQSSKPIVGFNQ